MSIKSKKIRVGILGGLLALAILGFVLRDKLVFLFPFSKKMIVPLVKDNKQKKEDLKFDWVVWKDPAGFSFEYPKSATIGAHPEDKINYSHLELSKKGREGKIVILCNDSQYADIDEWQKKDQLVKNGNSLETEIASMSAKRIALKDGREITGFIDGDKVLYTIDLQSQTDYWKQSYRHLLDSFKLIPLEGESEAEFNTWLKDFDTSGADVVEPVELIE